jgi:hypothetical protein
MDPISNIKLFAARMFYLTYRATTHHGEPSSPTMDEVVKYGNKYFGNPGPIANKIFWDELARLEAEFDTLVRRKGRLEPCPMCIRQISKLNLLFILPYGIMELPFIGAIIRIIVYGIAGLVDPVFIPVISVYLEPILTARKIYKLPSRIQSILSICIKIYNYIKSNVVTFKFSATILGVVIFFYADFMCDAPRA